MGIELDDVPVDSLVPEPLRDVSGVSDFMQKLPEYDGDMARQLEEAESADECLRFVGKASTSPFFKVSCTMHQNKGPVEGWHHSLGLPLKCFISCLLHWD